MYCACSGHGPRIPKEWKEELKEYTVEMIDNMTSKQEFIDMAYFINTKSHEEDFLKHLVKSRRQMVTEADKKECLKLCNDKITDAIKHKEADQTDNIFGEYFNDVYEKNIGE